MVRILIVLIIVQAVCANTTVRQDGGKRVGFMQMTNHEFMDNTYRKQRSTFSDGTTVTIDLDADTYKIEPAIAAD